MRKESKALELNQTWSLIDLPPDKKAIIGSKWIFKIINRPDGYIERYKQDWWQKGYNQVKDK